MNEDLKKLLATLKIDISLRIRLNKIFDQSFPIKCIDLRGLEQGRKLEVAKEDLSSLLRICKAVPTLQSFTILGHELDDESAFILADSIESLTSLDTFNIDNSEISDKGAIKIANMVSKHQSIKSFCLHGNAMGDLAVDAIVRAILHNRNIKRLSIQGKYISDNGINLIENLFLLNRLEQIVIIGKSINSNTCKSIGEKLAQDNQLKSLVLEFDVMDDINVVLDGIRINSFLTDVILVAHNIEPSRAIEIEEELEAINLRNVQGYHQRAIESMLIQMRLELGLQTHSLDQALSKKIVEIMQTRHLFQISSPRAEEGEAAAAEKALSIKKTNSPKIFT